MPRLSPQRKQKIRQRAQAQARRESGNAGAVAQAQIAGANRDYGREAQSARGAQAVELSQLNHMLDGIRSTPGLKGKYAAQIVGDIRSRKLDSVSGLPFAIADANEARRDAISTARTDLLAAQSDQQQNFGETYSDLLGDARKAKQSRIDDQEENPGGLDRGVKNALISASVILKYSLPKDRKNYMSDPDAFADGVSKKTEGADITDARKAIGILFARMKKKRESNIMPGLLDGSIFEEQRRKREGR